jgi:hypothetical protein
MELEELKEIWKSHDQGYAPKAEAEIMQMLKGQSNSIVNKLKRNVWFELVITIASSIALGVYTFTLEAGAMMWTIISMLLLFAGFLFYYVKKLLLLQRFDDSADNIKNNLRHLYDRLTLYMSFYKRSYAVLFPVYFCLGILFGAMERGMDNFLDHVSQPKTILILVVLAAAFFFCTGFITNFYLKKLYGNHLTRLKKLLDDLQH